jgi:ABC-type antimicrobial peptide transport system permease subunit
VDLRKSSLIALRSLRRNRLQTALTILGMTIGVGTVLVMVAVGTGAQTSILGQVRAAGMNVIVVTSGNYRMQQQWTSEGEAEEPAAWSPPRQAIPRLRLIDDPQNNPIQRMERGVENLGGLGGATTLSLADAAAIASLPGIQAVSGGMHENAVATAGPISWLTQVRGEQATLPSIRRAWVLSHGRFFTPTEDRNGEPVAVLGSIVAAKLFADKNPVGERIELRGTSYKIVGVIASGSWMVPSAPGDGQFDAIYISVRAAQRLFGRSHLDTLTLATTSTGDVARMTKVVREELRNRHNLNSTLPDDFTVASQSRAAIARGGMRTDISRAMVGNADGLDKVTLAQLSKTLEQAGRTMAVLLASIAAVSLVVGGIGIMNIMLLSVTERTREIGIRRAVGARSDEVMQQFLMEAVLLSLTGGVLGIVLGLSASNAVAHIVQWSTSISALSILFSFAVSAAVGIVFGYYPARQASRVTPMTSLRYE